MSTCQQNSSAPRGAVRTQRLSCGGVPNSAARAGSAVRIIAVPISPSCLERGRRPARDHPELERRARRPRADQQRLVVDRDEPLAAAHLLGGDVAEQVPAHRPLVVGGGSLALAGDRRRGTNAQRVELGVGVLERGAGVGALVDDQVDVGGVLRVGPHPLAPGRDGAREALVVELAQRGRVLGGVDDHLVGAAGRAATRRGRARRPGSRRRSGSIELARPGLGRPVCRARRGALRAPRRRGPGRGSGRPGTVHPGESGAPPPGRAAQTSGGVRSSRPSQNGQVSAASSVALRRRRGEGVGALGPARREDRAQAGELVDADLGSAHRGR